MKVAFFDSRCLICFKGFKVPKLPDSSYGDNLYYDKREKAFSYFSWFENKEIQDIISNFLSTHSEIQARNDDTKGNTAIKLVGLIADGDKEPVFGFNRCPRCAVKLNYVSNNRTSIDTITELSFYNFCTLNEDRRRKFLSAKTKNGL
jgi:hypothetical protein